MILPNIGPMDPNWQKIPPKGPKDGLSRPVICASPIHLLYHDFEEKFCISFVFQYVISLVYLIHVLMDMAFKPPEPIEILTTQSLSACQGIISTMEIATIYLPHICFQKDKVFRIFTALYVEQYMKCLKLLKQIKWILDITYLSMCIFSPCRQGGEKPD